MRLKTFAKGGVHPPENKLSSGSPIEVLAPPPVVTIPVSQHIGAPATVLVKRGDEVKVGQVIGEASGFISTNTHSSVSGKVLKVDNFPDPSGYRNPAVQIEVDGDQWIEDIDRSEDVVPHTVLGQDDIRKKILDAGIVGLGGATFPSHVKLTVPGGKTAEYLIINGVECEPYLTADHALMMERSEELLAGIEVLMKGLGVEKAIVGIENNKPDAIRKLTELTAGSPVRIQGLRVKYPQGGEKQLVKALLNREVPSGGLPIDVGVVVFNVGTTLAAYEAVMKNKPLIERVVTVTGKTLEKPANLQVRIGTPVSLLVEHAGGLPDDTAKVVSGGPMMGKALAGLDIPVVKGSSGILLIAGPEARRKEVLPCIRCTKCVGACPMGLEPYLLMTLSQKARFETMEQELAMDCIECGSCSYICPSSRPLLDYIRLGKTEITKIRKARKAV